MHHDNGNPDENPQDFYPDLNDYVDAHADEIYDENSGQQ